MPNGHERQTVGQAHSGRGSLYWSAFLSPDSRQRTEHLSIGREFIHRVIILIADPDVAIGTYRQCRGRMESVSGRELLHLYWTPHLEPPNALFRNRIKYGTRGIQNQGPRGIQRLLQMEGLNIDRVSTSSLQVQCV